MLQRSGRSRRSPSHCSVNNVPHNFLFAELACHNQQLAGIAAAAGHLHADCHCAGHTYGAGAEEVSANRQQALDANQAEQTPRESEQYYANQCPVSGGSSRESHSRSQQESSAAQQLGLKIRRRLATGLPGTPQWLSGHTRRHWH